MEIQWGFDSRGRQPAREAYAALEPAVKARLERIFREWSKAEAPTLQRGHQFKSLRRDPDPMVRELWEFKSGVTGATGQYRLIGAFRPGGRFVIVHLIRKKSDNIPRRELGTAARLLQVHDDYEQELQRVAAMAAARAAPPLTATPPPTPPPAAPAAPTPTTHNNGAGAAPPEPPADDRVWAYMRRGQVVDYGTPLWNNLPQLRNVQAGAVSADRVRAYIESRVRGDSPLLRALIDSSPWAWPLFEFGGRCGLELGLIVAEEQRATVTAPAPAITTTYQEVSALENELDQLIDVVPPVAAAPPPTQEPAAAPAEAPTNLAPEDIVLIKHAKSRHGNGPMKRSRILLARIIGPGKRAAHAGLLRYETYHPVWRKWCLVPRPYFLHPREIVGRPALTDIVPGKHRDPKTRKAMPAQTVAEAMKYLPK